MRSYVAIALSLLVLSAMAMRPAMAFNETASPFFTTDCTIFMFPICNTGLTVTEFNALNAASIENESFSMNFPMFNGIGDVFGPSAATNGGTALFPGGGGLTTVPGSTASANVLPFGPVNLAFPSLAQTVNCTNIYQNTYFFTDVIG